MKSIDSLELIILIFVFILTYLFFHRSIILIFYHKSSFLIRVSYGSIPSYRILISLFYLDIFQFLDKKMIERVEIKYIYDHHEKSNTCIENMYHSLLVPVMIFIC